jgi:hypothetical protein
MVTVADGISTPFMVVALTGTACEIPARKEKEDTW